MEVQMVVANALKPSAPIQFPSPPQEQATMKWNSLRIVEIAVGLEINAYACADLNQDWRSSNQAARSPMAAIPVWQELSDTR
jgi:coenzyme PQQ precursor peptide PqqA